MKQNKVFVAITGGIGSGKSSALACIKSMGYPCFSADEFGRGIYKEKTVFEETARAFPHCIKAGEVDRKMLAETVFSDPEKLEKEKNLQRIILEIRKKYGKNAILKGTSLQDGATARERHQQIGGHRA